MMQLFEYLLAVIIDITQCHVSYIYASKYIPRYLMRILKDILYRVSRQFVLFLSRLLTTYLIYFYLFNTLLYNNT